MTNHEQDHGTEGESGLESPGPGSPVADSPEEANDESSQATGTPKISSEDQEEGQTTHPAPEEDVGVPEDVGE